MLSLLFCVVCKIIPPNEKLWPTQVCIEGVTSSDPSTSARRSPTLVVPQLSLYKAHLSLQSFSFSNHSNHKVAIISPAHEWYLFFKASSKDCQFHSLSFSRCTALSSALPLPSPWFSSNRFSYFDFGSQRMRFRFWFSKNEIKFWFWFSKNEIYFYRYQPPLQFFPPSSA